MAAADFRFQRDAADGADVRRPTGDVGVFGNFAVEFRQRGAVPFQVRGALRGREVGDVEEMMFVPLVVEPETGPSTSWRCRTTARRLGRGSVSSVPLPCFDNEIRFRAAVINIYDDVRPIVWGAAGNLNFRAYTVRRVVFRDDEERDSAGANPLLGISPVVFSLLVEVVFDAVAAYFDEATGDSLDYIGVGEDTFLGIGHSDRTCFRFSILGN